MNKKGTETWEIILIVLALLLFFFVIAWYNGLNNTIGQLLDKFWGLW